MKGNYNIPTMGITYFADNVHAATVSGIGGTDGVNITEKAMNDKGIDRIEKISLAEFSLTY